jgi:hypothetical protein
MTEAVGQPIGETPGRFEGEPGQAHVPVDPRPAPAQGRGCAGTRDPHVPYAGKRAAEAVGTDAGPESVELIVTVVGSSEEITRRARPRSPQRYRGVRVILAGYSVRHVATD